MIHLALQIAALLFLLYVASLVVLGVIAGLAALLGGLQPPTTGPRENWNRLAFTCGAFVGKVVRLF